MGLQLLSAPQADNFLSFKMDPLPICIIHKQNKYQDFRQKFFTSKSNPAAPVSGENYLYLHGSIYYVVSKCFYYKHPLYYIDGQLLMAYIPLEAFCLLPLEVCLMSFLSPSRL